jgi:hypothetical protein
MACQCVVAEPTDYRAEDGFELPIRHSMRMFGGYKEKGNINTPLELAIQNQTDRFSLAIDAIDRVPRFQVTSRRSRSTPQPADRGQEPRPRIRCRSSGHHQLAMAILTTTHLKETKS